MFADQRCTHGVAFGAKCPQCLQIGSPPPPPPMLNTCHRTYHLAGWNCPQPGRQTPEGCDGCVEFKG